MAVRSGGATDPVSRIERVIARQERRFRNAFAQAVSTITDPFTLDLLADLLEQGRFEEALEGLDAAGAVLGNAYGEALSDSARDTARFLSTALTVTVSFDQVNQRAVDMIRMNSLRLIREFTGEQRRAVREALTLGIARGANPIEQARDFRGSIGLTTRQVRAVENFRTLLTQGRRDGLPSETALNRALRDGRFDRTVMRAIRDGQPLTAEQVDRMVDRYRQRYVRYRSEVIARTEALRAANEGTEEMYRQAIDAGQVQPAQLRRTWITAKDERVRGSHARLNGQVRMIGEAWQGDEGELRYPGDPTAPASETVQCRCVLATEIVE